MVDFKDKVKSDGANLSRAQEFELLRPLIEIIAERQRIMEHHDAAVLLPAFEIDRFRSLENFAGGRNVNCVHWKVVSKLSVKICVC